MKVGNSMTNKYLEKIAEKAEKKQGIGRAEVAAGGGLAVGGVLASGAPSRILGYHNVHHGTSKDLAKKIKRGGFDPSRGGTRIVSRSPRRRFLAAQYRRLSGR